jgi:hypothetical protein
MLVSVDDFIFSKKYLENLVDSNVFAQISIELYRGFVLKNKQSFFSILLTEVFTFIILLILVIPAGLVCLKSWLNFPSESISINLVILILLGFCLGLMLLINTYLWVESKKNKSLAILLNKAEQYNQIIKSIKVLEYLESVNLTQNSESWANQNTELIEALQIIKDSLIQAFRIEKFIRENRIIINKNSVLFNDIENNLTALMTFDFHSSSSQYKELLKDAIQIGITVHKEMRKFYEKR